MSQPDKGYELKILKMMINKYLDETTSLTEESPSALEINCDQVVWDLATRIYSQSGHKVELSTVRDVVNSRIGAMKYQLAAEKERIAEQARRVAEQKAQQAAEQARRAATQEAHLGAQIASVLAAFGGDETKAQVFVKTRKIICEQSGMDEDEVNVETRVFSVDFYKGGGWLSSSIPEKITAWNFKAEEVSSYREVLSTEWDDESGAMELLMALEEEFDIEIPDYDVKNLHTLKDIVDYIVLKDDVDYITQKREASLNQCPQDVKEVIDRYAPTTVSIERKSNSKGDRYKCYDKNGRLLGRVFGAPSHRYWKNS